MIPLLVGLGVFVLVGALAFGFSAAGLASVFFFLAFALEARETGALLASPFQIGMLLSAGLVGFGRLYAWRPRMGELVRALYAAAAFVALVSLHYLGRVAEGLPAWALAVHGGSFLVAYALLTVAYLAAVLGYLQHLALKQRPWQALKRPPLLVLAGLELPYLRLGYLAYTAGLFTGMAWAFKVWGSPISWDPKEVLTLAAWSLFTARLLLPQGVGPGARVLLWTAAFFAMAAAFFAAPLIGGRHPV